VDGERARRLTLVIATVITTVITMGHAVAAPPAAMAAGRSSPDPSTPDQQRDLQARIAVQTDQVGSAQADLAAAARAANAALEAYSSAVHARQLAQVAQDDAERRLAQAERVLAAHQVDLGRWARQAYFAGTGLAADPTLLTLLGGATDDLGHSRRLLSVVGAERDRAVAATARAVGARELAAQRAAQAAADTQAAMLRAGGAKAARDTAVSTARTSLTWARAALQASQDAAAQAAAQARRLAQARTYLPGGGGPGNAITGEVGSCAGGEMTLYANGQIPLDALCPLWGAPGDLLRADAAFAFNRLSTAYAEQFGRPICVTDSYRSYPEQVAVKADRPGLAATPGTSNHGWGTALDLCGGVQSFTSVQHHWMLLNAPAFGWFHPSWAGRDGSLPEPWHWEFGG
jgi:hypothetical protein